MHVKKSYLPFSLIICLPILLLFLTFILFCSFFPVLSSKFLSWCTTSHLCSSQFHLYLCVHSVIFCVLFHLLLFSEYCQLSFHLFQCLIFSDSYYFIFVFSFQKLLLTFHLFMVEFILRILIDPMATFFLILLIFSILPYNAF